MAKPSASELQKAAEAVDLDGFDYEVTIETSAGPISLMLDAANAPGHVRNLVALAESGFYNNGCFHRITGVLSSQRNSILGAEILSLADDIVLDRFFVSDLDHAHVPTNDRLSLIQQKLIQAIKLKEDVNPTFRQVWSASSETTAGEIKPLPSRVGIDNKSAQKHTIITVFAYDRLGLLYKITKVLFDLGLDVHVAKIGTYIDQVVDVFYVTDRNGNKIESKEQFHAIREELLEQIEK